MTEYEKGLWGRAIIGTLAIVAGGFVFFGSVVSCGKQTIRTENKADGEVEVHQVISITQDVCVEKNGFVTPEDRRECILCLSQSTLCKKCEPPK